MSNFVQHVLANALEDLSWVDEFLLAHRTTLTTLSAAVCAVFAEAGIPTFAAKAGMFAWIDVREALREDTYEAERELWTELYDSVKVLVTPGEDCHAPPGFFRVCFGAQPLDVSVKGGRGVAGIVRSAIDARAARTGDA